MVLGSWVCKDFFKIYFQFCRVYQEVGLLDHTVVLFRVFLRKCHTVSRSGCIILQPHQQCTRVPVFFHILNLLFSVLFLFLYFCGTGVLHSGLRICKAGALLLEPRLQPWLFLFYGSQTRGCGVIAQWALSCIF
jgi:hypothetical protein